MRLFRRRTHLSDWLDDFDRSIEVTRAKAGDRFERTAVDPSTLTMKAWSPGDTTSTYCYCGHERAAHATAFFYDGTCVVDGCTICKVGGHMPGIPVEPKPPIETPGP